MADFVLMSSTEFSRRACNANYETRVERYCTEILLLQYAAKSLLGQNISVL